MNKEQLVNWFTLEGYWALASPMRKTSDAIPYTLAPRGSQAGYFRRYQGGVKEYSGHPNEKECDLNDVPEHELREVFDYLKDVS